MLLQNKIPGLLSLEGYQVHIRYKLYPVTFGNDNKSYQNKSHNDITVQLCAKVA